ncbi:MAG: hypothetical protein BMS9Abin26_1927 [Gammaproteobacteria bacterium]|nr:MAG: hypothetical protein BMS9Abin26_1927 [Gammaproteobacteria bacterium]
MSLSGEDALRLKVLLANPVQAIRIDENNMVVFALTPDKEAKIALNPNCRAGQYLKQVREFLSGHVLGSPGGYPVYLKRWTRMGQARDESLADMLMLGEPEAVIAVACAPGITNELARRVWWIQQDAENARRMLESTDVVSGDMGMILADFLVEFLPFESEPENIIRSVRLLLQGDLIDDATRMKIWERGNSKSVFRIGFLDMTPDSLPQQQPARHDYARYQQTLQQLAEAGNTVAPLLSVLLDSAGQSFLHTVQQVIKRPASQEAVVALFDIIGQYFRVASPEDIFSREVMDLISQADAYCHQENDLAAIVQAVPQLASECRAMAVLGQVNEQVVLPVFACTDAMGSVMRKKLEPITGPLRKELNSLLSPDCLWPEIIT